ncbi:MAG: polysaccharide deacetylase family protein [Mycetocola sp.]
MNVNLCFHGIGTIGREREAGESQYWVSTDRFLSILDVVADHPSVRLSFDDGNRSDVDVALPSLHERGLTASFFVLAGRLDDTASLSPHDLRELRSAGMAIGNHGWTHTPWRGLNPADAQRELVDARAALADASGGAVADAALPLGRYDRHLLRRLARVGYGKVYTSDRFPARSSTWLQSRYSVTAADTAESIGSLLTSPPGLGELRVLGSSMFKRVR